MRPSPEVSFTRSTIDQETTFAALRSKSSTFEVGISGLHYIGKWDQLRVYLSPGYLYRHGEGSISGANVPETNLSRTIGHTFKASFGAQHSLHERFSVLGEVGLQYVVQRVRSEFSPNGNHTRILGSRTAVGVVLYF